MEDINQTINEIENTTRNVQFGIDDDTMRKINEQLQNAKTEILQNLEKYNKRMQQAQEEQRKIRIKEEYVNSLKRDIFTMLNTHIPIGSNIYDANYEELKELTPAQQIALYQTVFEQLNTMLEQARGKSVNNHLISELALAIYTWGSSKLSSVSSNLANKGLEISNKTIAIITSIEFLYNYLPYEIRSSLEGIPYVGSMFRIANHIQPVVVGVQNTAAVSASIYMALKSGGIDPKPFIDNVLSSCQRTGQRMMSSVSTTVSNVCSDILSMFQIRFDDTIEVEIYFTPSPEQIPLLSYASYEQSQIILQEPEQSASAIASSIAIDLGTLITQLNERLRETQEVQILSKQLESQQLESSSPSSDDDNATRKRGRSDNYSPSKRLRLDDDEELTGGRRRRRTKRRRSLRRSSLRKGGYRKKRYTNRRRNKRSKRRHYKR